MERVILGLNYWTQWPDESLVTYSISIAPSVNTAISIIDNTRANLIIQYNTLYILRIVSNLCGQRNTTVLIEVNYGKYVHGLRYVGNIQQSSLLGSMRVQY